MANAELKTDQERIEELMATFDVSRQQAAQMLQAERGEIPLDRVEVEQAGLAPS